MSNPERQFPGIRVLGTIGWIAAGMLIGVLEARQVESRGCKSAAVAAALLGIFCLTLPQHAAAEGRRARRRCATCWGSTRLALLQTVVVRRVRHRLVPDLHSAAVLLRRRRICFSTRSTFENADLQDDLRPDVRNLLHAGHAVLFRPAGRQVHAAGRHGRLGRSLCAVRVWRYRTERCGCSISASSCTASATTSSSSPATSTSIARPPTRFAPRPRASSRSSPGASAATSARCAGATPADYFKTATERARLVPLLAGARRGLGRGRRAVRAVLPRQGGHRRRDGRLSTPEQSTGLHRVPLAFQRLTSAECHCWLAQQ